MTTSSAIPRVPPLQPGDRLTRAEFERRFHATPNLKKAELLEGIVYMPPPVSHDGHSAPHFNLIGWLGLYRFHTPGVEGGDNGSLRLDLDNEPQPDAYLLILPQHGGHARISDDHYVDGAPEFIAEVSASTVSYDLHVKLQVYRRNGVQEYVVWRVFDQAIDWFTLREGRYERLTPSVTGLYKSGVLPGLWLDPAALIRGDLASVARTAQEGIAQPEHAEFVECLRRASQASSLSKPRPQRRRRKRRGTAE